MKTTLSVLAVIMLVDAVGFLMWQVSGQTPIDSFYIGTITKNLLILIK